MHITLELKVASTRIAVIEIRRGWGVAAAVRCEGLQPLWFEVGRGSTIGTSSSLAHQALTARRCCATLMTPGYLRPILYSLGGGKSEARKGA